MSKNYNDCDIVFDLLPFYLDGKTGVESNAFVREHLSGCEKCREIYRLMGMEIPERDPACGIVQDLLLSHHDGLTGESVTQMIEEHLVECSQCQRQYEKLKRQQETEEKKEVSRGKRFAKKLKKIWLGILMGAAVSLIILSVLFIIFMLLFLFGGPAKVTGNIAAYEETMSKYSNLQTGFISFPEEIPDSATNTKFYFSYQDTWNYPTCEVFLQCTYDAADYEAEIERLENTRKVYGSTERTLLRDEEGRFPYPAYIAVDGSNHAYEYALLSGEKQITYIYTAYKYEKNLKKIEERYLPSDYDSYQEELGFGEGYTIYLMKTNISGGYQLDCTRDEIVDVMEYHSVDIGYNLFSVRTRLDEEDNEIIQYCAFRYYMDEQDSYTGDLNEVRYGALEGYRFKSIELNDDWTKAIITYYSGEEEMTMEYEIPEV